LVVSIATAITTLAATYSSFMLAASKARLVDAKNVTNENLSFYKIMAMFQFGSQLLILLEKMGSNQELSQVLSE
jgi:hypothetical protein